MSHAMDQPPQLTAMTAIVRQAEQNERLFFGLTRRFDEIGAGVVTAKRPERRILEEWRAMYQRIANVVRDQTEVCKRGADVFAKMHAEYTRASDLEAQIRGEYVDLYQNFVERLQASDRPVEENLRHAVIAFQLANAEKQGLESRLKSLESGVVPEAQGRIDRLTGALEEAVAYRTRLLWSMAGLVSAPAVVVFVFWLLRV